LLAYIASVYFSLYLQFYSIQHTSASFAYKDSIIG